MSPGSTTRISGRHYRSGRAIELTFAGDRFLERCELPADAAKRLPWIAPGLVDVQSNGYGGQEFSSPSLSVDKVVEIAEVQSKFGVTQFCPTLTTASRETVLHGLATIAEARRRSAALAVTIAGIHLEGPYISRDDGARGAHPFEHCRPPDWQEFELFQRAAENLIRIVTLSPEYPSAAEFIAHAVNSGVVVAIGHTSADSAQIRSAVEAGATLSTHLGNGAHRMLRRHPNYLWDQMAEDRLMASLIVDGHHLPAEVVKTIVRAKTPGAILVSDLSGLAGMPPGRYTTELCELEILADGRLVIAGQDQLLAGASLPIGVGVANVMRFAGVDLATAIQMASHQPAKLLGLSENDLRPGDRADAVLFDLVTAPAAEVPSFLVRATLSAGQLREFSPA